MDFPTDSRHKATIDFHWFIGLLILLPLPDGNAQSPMVFKERTWSATKNLLYNDKVDVVVQEGSSQRKRKARLDKPMADEVFAALDFGEKVGSKFKGMKEKPYCNATMDQRTLWMTICPAHSITLESLEVLRVALNAEMPHWRIVLGNCEDESTIVIYPDALVFPSEDEPATALKKVLDILSKEEAIDSEQQAMLQRQRLFARCELQTYVPLEQGAYPPKIIAITELRKSRIDQIVVWCIDGSEGREKGNWFDRPLYEGDGFRGVQSDNFTREGIRIETGDWQTPIGATLTEAYFEKSKFRNRIHFRHSITGEDLWIEVDPKTIMNDRQVRERLKAIDASQFE